MSLHLTQRLCTLLVLGCFSSLTWAQFVWIDDKGEKHYSDQPPPSSIPKNKVLKDPRKARVTESPATATNDTAADGAPAAAGSPDADKASPPTLAEQNAAYNKRMKEKAEKDKKAEIEATNKAAKAQNCQRAQAYAKDLQEGRRIATTTASGERSYLDDSQRASELSLAQTEIAKNCQ